MKIQHVDGDAVSPKDLQRAALTDEAGLMIKCYYCGHMMKDEGVKIKLDGKYHYLCCSVCAKLYKEKYEKLKKVSLDAVQ